MTLELLSLWDTLFILFVVMASFAIGYYIANGNDEVDDDDEHMQVHLDINRELKDFREHALISTTTVEQQQGLIKDVTLKSIARDAQMIDMVAELAKLILELLKPLSSDKDVIVNMIKKFDKTQSTIKSNWNGGSNEATS